MTDDEHEGPEDPEEATRSEDAERTRDAAPPQDDGFRPLTVDYERLRHSTDSSELSAEARRTLPDRSDQAAFSRATALLEAVAGNAATPVDDRVLLATTMPFPNILVKLSEDPDPRVRAAVAGNPNDKNWLVGRLTKDPDVTVRGAALRNPSTSWRMRLEGAQDPRTDTDTLGFLAGLGLGDDGSPRVLAVMVRRAVALNPSVASGTLDVLAGDPDPDVARAARSRRMA